MTESYTEREQKAYMTGMLGQNMLYAIISTGLNYYFQSVIFIPAIAISIIFAVSQTLDVIKDPLVGTLVDRTNTKWGKCRPYLIFSPAIVALFSILCFVNGIYSAGNNHEKNVLIIIWAALCYFLWGIAYAFCDSPLGTLPLLMTSVEKDRSWLISLSKNAAYIGGGIVMVAIVPVAQLIGAVITEQLGDNEKGLQYGVVLVAAVLTIIGALLFQMTGLFTKERVQRSEAVKNSLTDNIKTMWQCRPYRRLLISGLLRSPTVLLTAVQMTLFAYYYGDNGRSPYIQYLLLLGGGIMVGQLVSSAVAPKLMRKNEKKKLYINNSLLFSVSQLMMFALYLITPTQLDRPVQLIMLFALMIASGYAQGVVSVLKSVMTADSVDYHEYKTGYRPDGVFVSGQTMLIKLSSAISSLIAGIVYAAVGFSGEGVKLVNDALYAGASFKSDPQFAMYRFAIFFLFTIPPAISTLFSVFPMRKYELNEEEHKRILGELEKTRTAAEENA